MVKINDEQSMIYSTSINNEIYDLITKNKTILDVGCNSGNLGKRLIAYKNCKVYGIDYSKKVIRIAKKNLTYAKVFDLESGKIPFNKKKFDIIIFADVLEHIKNSEEILTIFSQMLNKNGMIIISIPNVANINIRLNLLLGKWNYKKWGILDRTHLKFYTKETALQLVKNCGYNITNIFSTPGFDFLIFKFKFFKKIKKYACLTYPNLFALQFIIIGEKK